MIDKNTQKKSQGRKQEGRKEPRIFRLTYWEFLDFKFNSCRF